MRPPHRGVPNDLGTRTVRRSPLPRDAPSSVFAGDDDGVEVESLADVFGGEDRVRGLRQRPAIHVMQGFDGSLLAG